MGGDDEELDSEFIGSGVGGGVADLNGSAHRRHIVELNEDDEEDDYDDSHAILSRAQQVNSSPQRLRGSSAAASNSISTILNDSNKLNRIAKRINKNMPLLLADDSGEIETINTTRKNAIKHQLMEETVAAQNGAEPLSKKLKTTDQATSSATSLNQNNVSSSFHGSSHNPIRVVEVYNKPSYLTPNQVNRLELHVSFNVLLIPA